MSSMMTLVTIKATHTLFARFGLPCIDVSDNGRQFGVTTPLKNQLIRRLFQGCKKVHSIKENKTILLIHNFVL